ncbi:MAG: AAA domain-containing protein [Chitinophagaceae bacterium]|nr:AAA domain-containing protein [Chitinophagaceae bacterium]
MEYFIRLLELLKMEREQDRDSYRKLIEISSINERRAAGLTWYPVAIRDTELGRGDYITVEIERTTQQDIPHQFRFGSSAALFSNHNPKENRTEGIIAFQAGNRLKITLKTDELPDWSKDGKLGLDLLFDENSYHEMRDALMMAQTAAEKPREGHLIQILTGKKSPEFNSTTPHYVSQHLNPTQQDAVNRILAANELAIVHGPPGTGKTTTLVQAIKALLQQDNRQILVTAPSNTAVDLLTEKCADEGLNVVRVGNPARVSERLLALTLDSKVAGHAGMKEVKKMKKQANELRNMAHKYKRHFGKAEREQRKALFDEAHRIIKEIDKTEQYITDDLLNRAQVITATLIGANHYTVRQRRYHTAVIDEAAQAIEPACWIPVLKAEKIVLAGDHCQLPPTIKSEAAAQNGLGATLFEKCVQLHPQSVVLLEEQYRMNETIMGYSSAVFYQQRLKAHSSVARRLLYEGDPPLLFVDTAGCGFEEKTEGINISNPEEAAFVFSHLTQLVTKLSCFYQPGNFPSIAVISPYRQQIQLLKEQFEHTPELHLYRDKISVNTIDSFQGQERDIVYISLTRSNPESRIGFLSEIRRMNVAMTRARKKLVVIGDSATLGQFPFYADFITYAERHNAWQSAWEYMVD